MLQVLVIVSILSSVVLDCSNPLTKAGYICSNVDYFIINNSSNRTPSPDPDKSFKLVAHLGLRRSPSRKSCCLPNGRLRHQWRLTFSAIFNLVPRVFRLFGQRGNAGKTLGTSKKFNFFDWLFCNGFHCFTAEILR